MWINKYESCSEFQENGNEYRDYLNWFCLLLRIDINSGVLLCTHVYAIIEYVTVFKLSGLYTFTFFFKEEIYGSLYNILGILHFKIHFVCFTSTSKSTYRKRSRLLCRCKHFQISTRLSSVMADDVHDIPPVFQDNFLKNS